MKLTMHGGGAELAKIEIGTGPDFDGDDSNIAPTDGNLYLFVDGVEVGSLWFHQEDGVNVVSLGCYDESEEGWEKRHTVVIPAGESKEG